MPKKFTEGIIRSDLQLYPRIPDPSTKHDSRFDSNYLSVQYRVNNDPEFEEKYIEKLVADGWVALKNVRDLLLYPKGRYFKYRLNGKSLSKAPEGTFRSGGQFFGRNENETDPEKYDNYILYKAYNGCIFCLQFSDILEVYIKSPVKERSVFKKPDPKSKSNFPVTLEDPNTGQEVVVYYGKDRNQQIRFMNSMKYQKARATGNWSWSVVFDNNF